MPKPIPDEVMDEVRADSHIVTPYVNFLQAEVLWEAIVELAESAYGVIDVDFVTGTGGAFSWIEAYQTLWVGTQAGLSDVGKCRVRDITSGDGGVTGTVKVNQNGILWSDGLYLTFKHNYELWGILPRIAPDETFYKDYDIPYTNQNEQIGGLVCPGPHQAKFIELGETVTFYFVDGAHSYALTPGTTISSVVVTVLPGTGVVVNPWTRGHTITVDRPGQYWVKFTITDSDSVVNVTYRCLFANPRPGVSWGTGSDPGILKDFDSISFDENWQNGGSSASIDPTDDVDLIEVEDEALCVVWCEAWYDGVNKAIARGGESDAFDENSNWSGILMVGYVRKEQVHKDVGRAGSATFEIATIDEMLRSSQVFSISLESSNSPSDWYQYLNPYLTTGRIVHHILRWHSSLLQVADLIGLLDNDVPRKYAEVNKANLYQMAEDVSFNRGIHAHLVCDKYGRMYLKEDLVLMDDPTRGAATIFQIIDDVDVVAPMTVVRSPAQDVSFVFLSGISYNGDVDDLEGAQPVGSTAPAESPDQRGASEEHLEKQIIVDQDESDERAGQIFAVRNNPYPEVRIEPFTGNYYGLLDPAYMGWWLFQINYEDTVRGITWDNKRAICRSVSASIDCKSGVMIVNAYFEPEVDGVPGVAYQWPTDPPASGGGTDPPPPLATGARALCTTSSLHYRPYIIGGQWDRHTTLFINHGDKDPFWVSKTDGNPLNGIVYAAGDGFVRKSLDAGRTWFDLPVGIPPDSTPVADISFTQYEGNEAVSGQHMFVGHYSGNIYLLLTEDDGATWDWKVLGGTTSATFNELVSATAYQVRKNGVARLTDTLIVTLFTDDGTSDLYVVAGIIGSSSISWGTPVLVTFWSSIPRGAVVEVTSTSFGVVYNERPASADSLYARMGSVSGTAITLGTPFDLPDSGSMGHLGAVLFGSGIIITHYASSGGIIIQSRAIAYTFSGLTITGSGSETDMTPGVAGTTSYPDIIRLNASQIVTVVHDSGGGSRVVAATVSGTTITPGTPVVPTSAGYCDLATYNSTRFILVTRWGALDIRGRIGTVTVGDAITFAAVQTIVTTTNVEMSINIEPDVGTTFALFSRDTVDDVTVLRRVFVNAPANSYTVVDTTIGAATEADSSWGITVVPGSSYAQTYESLTAFPYDARIVIYQPDISAGEPIGLSIGKGVGQKSYLTAVDGVDITLYVLELPSMDTLDTWIIAPATYVEVDAREAYAVPLALYGFDDAVYIFGRMDSPPGLTGDYHIIYSIDGGDSFFGLENSWGADHCGAMIQSRRNFQVFAMRNTGSSPKLYEAVDGLNFALKSTIPVHAGVNPKAMIVDFNGLVICAPKIFGDKMTLYSAYPYTQWVNFTGTHERTHGVASIFYL